MMKIKTQLWRRLYIYILCLPLFIFSIVFTLGMVWYLVTLIVQGAGWNEVWPGLIWLPLSIAMIPLMWVVLKMIGGNALVLTDKSIEYEERGSETIPYSAITRIDLGRSRRTYFFIAPYHVNTVLIHFLRDKKIRVFDLPHWMHRKEIMEELARHIDPKIVDKKVKERFRLEI